VPSTPSAGTARSEHGRRPDIPSLTNPRSDRVKAVRRLSGRSSRLRDGRFVVEGPQSVREAVLAQQAAVADGAPDVVVELYATPEAADRYREILDAAAGSGARLTLATPDVLAAMVDTVTPQGLVAVCRPVDVTLDDVLAGRPRLVAVLAQVRDPGNAGTVIRVADAAGADAVVLTESSVDLYNPKLIRSTAGSLFHLPLVTGQTLSQTVDALRLAGLQVLAADGAGEHDLDDLQDAAAADGGPRSGGRRRPFLRGGHAWVFGNEAWGLPQADRDLADFVVRVPVHGRAESLNLATAATVCLYASARAQRRPAGRGSGDVDGANDQDQVTEGSAIQ
jgi:RNA methyltransferase, TrmH family